MLVALNCPSISQESIHQPTLNRSGNPSVDAPPIPNDPSIDAHTHAPYDNMEVDSEPTQNRLSNTKLSKQT
jgi:hypothetical protein